MALFIRFLIIVAITGTTGGTLIYFVHDIFNAGYNNPNPGFSYGIFTGVIFSLATNVIFSIVKAYIAIVHNTTNTIKGIVCVLIVILLTIGLGQITFGANVRGLMYVLTTIGVANFFSPYLHDIISERMGLFITED